MNISRLDGLSGRFVLSLFEAGDAGPAALAVSNGSIWVGAQDGLTSWKDGQITIFRKAGGLPDDAAPSVFPDGRGRIWGFMGLGLAHLNDGWSVAIAPRRGGRVHFIAGDDVLA